MTHKSISSTFTRLWNWRATQNNNLIINFFRESSWNGFKYVGLKDVHIIPRILWLFALSYFFFAGIQNILDFMTKFNANPIMVSFYPNEIPLERVPFPAVTICSANNIRKSEVRKFKQMHEEEHRPGSTEANETLIVLQHMRTICASARSFSKRFHYDKHGIHLKQNDKKRLKDFDDELNAEVVKIVSRAQQNCSEMIQLCTWQNHPMECEKLFHQIYTDYGPCCVFNLMPVQLLLKNPGLSKHQKLSSREYGKWVSWNIDRNILTKDFENLRGPPRHQRQPGAAAGLSFMVNPEINEYFCPSQDSTGFQLVTDSPIDFPKVDNFGYGIEPNTETFVSIRPELTMIDPNIRDLPVEKRECYLSGEFHLAYFNYYTTKNCLEECLSNLTSRACNCTPFNMPRSPDDKVCFKHDYHCAHKVERNMSLSGVQKVCKVCLPACTQLRYVSTTSKLPMSNGENVWKLPNSNNSFAPWVHSNVSVIHVFFGAHSVYSRVRQKVFDTVDLVGNSGGIMTLYIGGSIASMLEVFYHFLFHVFFKKSRSNK